MAELRNCEFFLLRYVPDAVKNEFVNFGVVLMEHPSNGSAGFVDVRLTHDWRRVRCLDPDVDLEMLQEWETEIRSHLGEVEDRQKMLMRMQDSFSNTVQVSPMSACVAADPQREIETLAELYLQPRERGTRAARGRRTILAHMRQAFEQAGVWELMRKSIAAAPYTHPGDPLKIDCGYQPNGEVKLFQAVSLLTDTDDSKVLAFSYPQLAAGIQRLEKAKTRLTAVVEDELDLGDKSISFALATMQQSGMSVLAKSEMTAVAQLARLELRV